MSGNEALPLPSTVGVVIPACNEQRRVGRCVASVLAALDAANVAHGYIVIVADRCTDRTASLARSLLGNRGEVVECDAGSPGTARRLGTERLLDHLDRTPAQDIWLANTDADGWVPPDWIARQLTLAAHGAAAVAGIVKVDSFQQHGPDGAAVFAKHYVINADGTHDHVHGANLGVRADAYLRAGGWPDVAVGEDHCLWRRLTAQGSHVVASAQSIVTTSGRLQGRARGGFADTIARRLRVASMKPALSAEGGAP